MNRAEYRNYIASERWKLLRFAVEWRQQGRCALCGCVCKPMIIHHNDYARVGKERPEDLIGLCKRCNGRHHQVWRLKAEAALPDKQVELEAVT